MLSINISYKYQGTKYLTGALFLAFLFGLLTEFLQQFIPGRNMDFADAIADSIGVFIGYFLYEVYKFKIDKTLLKFGA